MVCRSLIAQEYKKRSGSLRSAFAWRRTLMHRRWKIWVAIGRRGERACRSCHRARVPKKASLAEVGLLGDALASTAFGGLARRLTIRKREETVYQSCHCARVQQKSLTEFCFRGDVFAAVLEERRGDSGYRKA